MPLGGVGPVWFGVAAASAWSERGKLLARPGCFGAVGSPQPGRNPGHHPHRCTPASLSSRSLLLVGHRRPGRVAVALLFRLGQQLSISCVAAMAAALLTLSQFATSIFLPRSTIPALPGFVLALAVVVSALRLAPLRTTAIVLLLASHIPGGAMYYPTVFKQQWRQATAFVETHAQPGDAIVCHSNTRMLRSITTPGPVRLGR